MKVVTVTGGDKTWLNSLLLHFNVSVQFNGDEGRGREGSWVWTSDSFVHIMKHFPIKKRLHYSHSLNFNSPGNQQAGTVIRRL